MVRRSAAVAATLAMIACLLPATAQGFVFWSNETNNAIGRATTDGNPASINQSFVSSANDAKGVAIDGNHIYWSNYVGNSIGRANLDGSGVNPNFITTGTNMPEGIAVDGNYIYWANTGANTIGRDTIDGNPANVNGSFIPGASFPVGVAVNGQFIYWANYTGATGGSAATGTIGRANLDGSGANPSFIPAGLANSPAGPAGVAIDNNYLYWTNYNSTTIGRDLIGDAGGAGAVENFIDTGVGAPIGLALDPNYVYWTNRGGPIGRDTIDGNAGNVQTPFITGAAGSQLWGIAVADPPSNIAPPSISGPAVQGQTLTEAHGSWSNAPSSFSLQWERCNASGGSCTTIPGATTGTYQPTFDDAGSTLRVREIATNRNGGTSSPATSAPTAVVSGLPPSNTGPPTISGTAVAGQTLSEAHGTWTNSPTSFSYQWEQCDRSGNNCGAIPGATGQTYAVSPADSGLSLRVQEAATNQYGTSAPATSNAAVDVAPVPQTSIVSVSTSGSSASLEIGCVGVAGQVCSGLFTLTSHVTTQGRTTVAVSASTKTRAALPKVSTVVAVASGGGYSVAAGKTQVVTIKLNAPGLKLLRQFYQLSATLTAGSASRVVTFSYPKIDRIFVFVDRLDSTHTFSQLSVIGGVPSGATVSLVCVKGGCSPRRAVFKLKGNNIKRSPKPFLRLRRGAAAYLEITKPDFVGKVLKITNPGPGRREITMKLCLPPGAKTPSKCAR